MKKHYLTSLITFFLLLFIISPRLSAQHRESKTKNLREYQEILQNNTNQINSSVDNRIMRPGERKVPEIRRMVNTASVPMLSPEISNTYRTVINGSLTNYSQLDFPEGIYSFRVGNNISMELTGANVIYAYAAVYVDKKYYSFTPLFTSYGYEYYFRVYDTDTWTQEKVILEPIDVESLPGDLTYDPVTNKVYGIVYSRSTGGFSKLCTIDLETAKTSLVGNLPHGFMVIAANAEGKLYGVDEYGDFYSINKTTAEATLIKSTGIIPGIEIQSAVYDNALGKIFWVACFSNQTSALYEIDPQTGNTYYIANMPNNEQMAGLFVDEPEAGLTAPARPENLKINFTSPGALTGKIAFKTPSTTFGGETLTGKLNATIRIEGLSPIQLDNLNPGIEYETVQQTFKQGVQNITLTVSNDKGQSPTAIYTTFAGTDVPSAVKNLTYEKTSNGKPLLKWEAPTESLYGGYFDEENLYYKIIRHPDNITIESNLRETSFIDNTIGDFFGIYSYTITPVSTGGEGKPVTTEEMSFNETFGIPYEENFDKEETVNLWTIVDINGYGAWSYDDYAQTMWCSPDWMYPADDWLISPPIWLKAGAVYEIKYTYKGLLTTYKENLRITLGTSVEIQTHTNILQDHYEFVSNRMSENTTTIYVSSTGIYHIGFHAYSAAKQGSVSIGSLKINELYAAGTPGAVTDLEVKAGESGELSASVSMKVPVLTPANEPLESISSIHIYKSNNEDYVKSFENPSLGEQLSWDEDNLETGLHTYCIVPFNNYGKGKEESRTIFVGHDRPAAVTNLVLADINNKPHLSWTSPDGGYNGGYVENLKYKIIRNHDNTVVEEAWEETSYTDNSVTADLAKYSYTVIPHSTGGEGPSTTSSTEFIGDGFSIPYEETFDTTDAMEYWNILTERGNAWIWNSGTKSLSQNASYWGSNAWIFSSAIKMYEGYTYRISYKIRKDAGSYPGRIRFSIANSIDPEDHKSPQSVEGHNPVVFDHDEIHNTGYETHTYEYMAAEDGKYYLGFYSYTPTYGPIVYLDDIKIEVITVAGVPNPVTEWKIEVGAQGMLSAKMSFRTPTHTSDGKTLGGIPTIDIYRNDDEIPVKTFINSAPDFNLSWEDAPEDNGLYTYRIIPSNEAGSGRETSQTVYIGKDVPAMVRELKIADISNEAVLSWNAPTGGLHEGHFEGSGMYYKVLRNAADNTEPVIVADNLFETNYTDNSFGTTQAVYSYTVIPVNSIGEGGKATTPEIVLGNPYMTPFNESFPNAKAQNVPWLMESIGETSAKWIFAEIGRFPPAEPQDNDNGLAYFNSFEYASGESARLISPKVDISSMVNPKLTFHMYHINTYPDREDKLQIEICTDGITFEELPSALFYLAETKNWNAGWTKYEIPLMKYREYKHLRFSFKAVSDRGSNIHIDNISITEHVLYDLEAFSITGPDKMQSGTPGKFTIEVKNKGAYTESDYIVHLYKDKEKIMSLEGTSLEPAEIKVFEFTVIPSLNDVNNSYPYYGIIEFSKDEDNSNNTTNSITYIASKPIYPVINDLDGEVDEDNNVSLSWSAPSLENAAEEVTEDFESYTPFIIDNIGEWTVIDMDGSETDAIASSINYPNRGAAMAFQVFDPIQAGLNGVDVYSGKQFLASFVALERQNDDWLISPELSGGAQTISFYAKSILEDYGLERIIVYYSTTGKETDNFTKISAGDYLEVPVNWTEYSFNLPAGSKYFAIRCVSDDAFVLMIDDISFKKANEDLKDLELMGYNVYRNNSKINETLLEENNTSYLDANVPNGSYTYKVTAVYNMGESYYSNEVSFNGLEVIPARAGIKVYSSDNSIIVEGASGKTMSIVTTDGIIIHTVKAKAYEKIVTGNGIYLVKIEDETYKVIVR